MPQKDCSIVQGITKKTLIRTHEQYRKLGLNEDELQNVAIPSNQSRNLRIIFYSVSVTLLITLFISWDVLNILLGIRCIVPHNYFTWEATRSLSDCSFCSNVTKPIELYNVTRKMFEPYAYSSQPIVVRQAFLHWPAMRTFSWQFFKELYADTEKFDDLECQFLHFKSDFISIRDVFEMSSARVSNLPGEKSWYVGWSNCHPLVLQEMRRHYPKPHFLPEDAEIPPQEYVFMGYDDGATMHLDFINRLMWQAQLQGSKIWTLRAPPECQSRCQPLKFLVHPGDAVLVDTRVWYHATTIPNGQFSLSIQSEYG